MKTRIAVMLFVLMMSGCAVQEPITKQMYIGSIKSADMATKMIELQPELVYCFGGDKRFIWQQLDNAVDDAIDSVGEYMPPVIDTVRARKAYLDDYSFRMAKNFFSRNMHLFSLNGLTDDQVQNALS